jgi:hypothetical protein
LERAKRPDTLEKKPSSDPQFTKKKNATLTQRIEILDWHHDNGCNQVKTANHFDKIYPNLLVKQPLISAWLKNEESWHMKWTEVQCTHDCVAKRARQTEHPQVMEMMNLWISRAMSDGIALTGETIRQKWTKFADMVGIPEDERLSLSNG